MSERLEIDLHTEDDVDFFALVKAKAKSEGLSIKEFVIDALKKRVEPSLPPPPAKPTVSPVEMNEFRRRIANSELALRGEIRKDREQIAILAEAIAQLETRLGNLE